MTTQASIIRTTHFSRIFAQDLMDEITRWVKSRLPRRCMIVSIGLLVTGISVPFLMGLAIIPATLLLGFIGMSFTCMGIVSTLYYL